MQNEKILFTAPGRAELLPLPMPACEGKQVLVKLAFSTVSSGTERANLAGEVYVNREFHGETEAVFPRAGGYSSAGRVVAVGSQATRVRPGDRVALSWSTHSRYVCIDEGNVHPLPDEIGFSEAALLHIATFPMAAIRKCRLEIGEPAIVMGIGILGMMAIKELRAAGAVPIIAADPDGAKRALALRLGADYALDPYAPDFVARVKEICGGVAVAIEVTGVGQALDQVLDCMRPFGRVALLGCTRRSDFTIDYYHKVHGPGISLIGAHTLARAALESSPGNWTLRDDVTALLSLLQCGRMTLADLVEETHRPEEAPEVYARLMRDKAFPVVQFDWRDEV